ncbi:MAG: hypothetical protein J6T10_15240 [Methanobrevibacter sp.]|nr:hypothetical protein [Methanobrevibacter sp.]MBO7693972.1 hypothetical protein [Methanobrevibacter sp.]
MAKKAFEKRERNLNTNQIEVYRELAEFREKRYDMERMKHIITFVFVILEALVI